MVDRLTKQHEAELRYIAAGPKEEFLAEALTELDATRADLAELLAGQQKCEHCGERLAVCHGRYECMTEDAFACDECCGHGCEDGNCNQLPTATIIRRLTRG